MLRKTIRTCTGTNWELRLPSSCHDEGRRCNGLECLARCDTLLLGFGWIRRPPPRSPSEQNGPLPGPRGRRSDKSRVPGQRSAPEAASPRVSQAHYGQYSDRRVSRETPTESSHTGHPPAQHTSPPTVTRDQCPRRNPHRNLFPQRGVESGLTVKQCRRSSPTHENRMGIDPHPSRSCSLFYASPISHSLSLSLGRRSNPEAVCGTKADAETRTIENSRQYCGPPPPLCISTVLE